MRQNVTPIILALFLFLPLASFAQQISDDTFRNLAKLSGMEKQVGELAKIVWAGFLQGAQGPLLSPSELARFKKAVNTSFDGSKLLPPEDLLPVQ